MIKAQLFKRSQGHFYGVGDPLIQNQYQEFSRRGHFLRQGNHYPLKDKDFCFRRLFWLANFLFFAPDNSPALLYQKSHDNTFKKLKVQDQDPSLLSKNTNPTNTPHSLLNNSVRKTLIIYIYLSIYLKGHRVI